MTRAEQELAALGQAIRRLREEQGVSPNALARAAGISRPQLDALEAGQVDPHLDTLLALADGMRVRPSVIFRRAEELDGER